MVARNFLYQWNKLMQLYGVKTMISSGPTMFAFTYIATYISFASVDIACTVVMDTHGQLYILE